MRRVGPPSEGDATSETADRPSDVDTATHDFRDRPALRRHHPRPLDGRDPEGQLRPSRPADGDGARRRRALPAHHAPRPRRPGLARSRPLHPQRRARLDAAVLDPAPHRLRPVARRAQELPPVGLADPRPPRARPRPRHARRRGHDRPARCRLLQRRRHGARREVPARALRRRGLRPQHLRDRLRRRPHGGHRGRGRLARRPARPRPARLPLRRQRHLARRPDVAELRPRGRRQALRGLRLARDRRPRRSRPRSATRRRSRTARRSSA